MRKQSLLVRAIALLFAVGFVSAPLLHAQGRGRVPGFGAVDRRLIRYADVTLTNAEVLLLGSTPKTIIRAFGAGTVIDVVGGLLSFNYTTAYTGGSDMKLFFGSRTSGSAASGTITASGTLVSVTADTNRLFAGSPGDTLGTANTAVVLMGTTPSAFAGGAAANTVIVHVAYRVHNTGL